VRIAGTYAPVSFSYDVFDGTRTTTHSYSGTSLTALSNVPSFVVSSTAPSVKIKEAYYASTSSQAACDSTDTSATVYFYTYTEEEGGVCGVGGRDYTRYKHPYVVIELSDRGFSDGEATLTFESEDGNILLYTREAGTITNLTTDYTWSGDGDCTRWVGTLDQKSGTNNSTRAEAGKLTAEVLKIKHGDSTYTIDIPDITINNPE